MNTTDILNLLLVTSTLSYQVRRITVEDIHVLLADVNMAEEIIPHEAVITLRVLFGQVHVLVHVERYDIAEGYFSGLVEFDEFSIHTERRTTGRKT